MNIKIHSLVITRLKELDISARDIGTVCFVLLALQNGEEDLLDFHDDTNKDKSMLLLYKQMQRRGLLEESVRNEPTLFHLTNIGEQLAEQLSQEIENRVRISIESENPETWIEEYIDLFPEGKPHGRPFRIPKSQCLPKMFDFVEKHNVDKHTIIEATRMWIDSYKTSKEGIEYLRDSKYFIKKRVNNEWVSDLETAIKMYQDSLKNPISNTFSLDIL